MNSLEKLAEAIVVLKEDIEEYNTVFNATGMISPKSLRQQALTQYNIDILQDTLDSYEEDLNGDVNPAYIAVMDSIFAEEMNMANIILGLPLQDYELDEPDYEYSEDLDFKDYTYDGSESETFDESFTYDDEETEQRKSRFQDFLASFNIVPSDIAPGNGEQKASSFVQTILSRSKVKEIDKLTNFPTWIEEEESNNADFAKGWERLAEKIQNIINPKETNNE